ncbi:hypothetical protein ABID29_000388 [Streptococcus rupicaprae]|uniref:Uncharacterized protein n=1 Tax=Streptococcus rupicaprae TaxID=759619 RepID=A0ABV2FFH7_9STRE
MTQFISTASRKPIMQSALEIVTNGCPIITFGC